MARAKKGAQKVELVPAGIRVGEEVVPLLAGTAHYWRLEPEAWRSALEGMRGLGLTLLDTYVPWGVHERGTGDFDFGKIDPKLDVVRFVRLAGELGLYVIVRPGPHINAELTCFGIPERVIWTKECQAVSAGGKPVALPVPPLAFPVPSYASEAFHAEARVWFDAVGRELSPLIWPNGPIVLLQVDNEGAMYFRDGVYDQDYHADAIAHYRAFLKDKYDRVEVLREVLGDPGATFFNVEPPRRFNAKSKRDLARHLDWAEFQEELIAGAFKRYRAAMEQAGLGGVPTSHNLPLSEAATPLDPLRVGEAVELLGLDYYHGASPPQRNEIARRTSELDVRSAAREHPAFACELGAGYPPFFAPLSEGDNAFTALTALAYGLRGYNMYMAVERDRWINAPIDPRGRVRPSAAAWERLTRALIRLRFGELVRHAPVHVLIPRSLRRLARVMHAFGPLSAALFQVLGGSAEDACFEDDLGLGASPAVEADQYVQLIERTLDAAGIPYAFSSDDVARHSFKHARWTIVACPGALDPELGMRVARARERGRAVTVGPHAPVADASFRPLAEPAVSGHESSGVVPALLPFDEAAVLHAVAEAQIRLELPTLFAEPADIRVTLHRDAAGTPRVLFVINATPHPIAAKVTSAGASDAEDALDGTRFRATVGVFELPVAARSVRMLELRA
ncbi:MAG TPA: beta-galactosidase [Polyangiaceae bacterium]|nr:beta-galactosidase [Polyangiaceae bacterium]